MRLQYQYGRVLDKNKQYEQAVQWYYKAAKQGYAFAQYNLGLLYNHGQGVTQDYKKAASWYDKAAKQGNASAQTNLGVLYNKGQGVTQDYKKAAELWGIAANQGGNAAQLLLGNSYYHGNGVPRNHKKAKLLFQLASKGRDAKVASIAQNNLSVMQERQDGNKSSTELQNPYAPYKDWMVPGVCKSAWDCQYDGY